MCKRLKFNPDGIVFKKIIIIVLLLIFYPGLADAGPKIAAVQSVRVKPYEDAVNGFKSVCGADVERIVISELNGTDVIKKIYAGRYDMVLAIGGNALSITKAIKKVPVLYLMVLNPTIFISKQKNIFGVGMNIPPQKQLHIFLKVLPGIKNIGVLYDPEMTGRLVENARDAAQKAGLTLTSKKIFDSKNVPLSIEEMRGKIDAFWMMPDITVITPETVEFLLLFSLRNGIPILTFSEKYVELGAVISVGIDAVDIGRQAGEMADGILSGLSGLSGSDRPEIRHVNPRKAAVSINLKTAKKLRLHIDKDIMKNARILH